MVRPTAAYDDHDWYLPLGEDSLLVLTSLLLFSLTAGDAHMWPERVRPLCGLGLEIDTTARQTDQPEAVSKPASGSQSKQDGYDQ